ncbi:LysR family transcriptional regulator [Cupriavidus sp. 30B13]|uniref:LysR family transcriptional regulator n=1 Tax=Cupriavidus sp. 30B13 TaxID=3384241 RepID=UPI003B921F4A
MNSTRDPTRDSTPGPALDGAPAPAASLDIGLLRTFLAVVDCGGFALAAESLSLTPSAISGHVKRLEQGAGAVLLERTTRSFTLTQAGELLYAYARNIVALERELRVRLHGAPARGRLRIGSSEDFAGTWLPRMLQAFRRWHPDVSVELKVGVTADLLRQQERGRLDIVFGKQCSRTTGGGELLWEEDLAWVHAADAPFDPAAEIQLAAFPEPCVYREAAVAALARVGRPWRLAFESSSMAGCLSAARAGFAVTAVARSQVREGLRVLDARDRMPALPKARFCAFVREGAPAAQALTDAVREAGRQHRFGETRGW